MSKMFTDGGRVALNGPCMGTRWSALFQGRAGLDLDHMRRACQQAVDRVDAQMSTWNPASDLMRLNAAPVGAWVAVPDDLRRVLGLGLAIGRASGGAFDIGMGDAVTAWGFGPAAATPDAIRAALAAPRRPAHERLVIEGAGVRKTAPIVLDLNGIAKGYGVDLLADTLRAQGITDALVGIDGEMRAMGLRPMPRHGPWRSRRPTPRAAQPIRSWRCMMRRLRPRAITATGSRCRAAACRIRWTPRAGRRWPWRGPR